MCSSSFIKIPRAFFNTIEFKQKPFSEALMWLYLCSKATFKPHSIELLERVYHLGIGDFVESERSLARVSGWSRGKVRRYLQAKEKDGWILRVENAKIPDPLFDPATDPPPLSFPIHYSIIKYSPYDISRSTPINKTDPLTDPLFDPLIKKGIKKKGSKKDLTMNVIDPLNSNSGSSLIPSSPNGSEVLNITPRIKMTRSSAKGLVEKFGRDCCEYYKEVCDDWLLSNGKKKKDYAAFMRNWIKRDKANLAGFYAKDRVKQFSCAATMDANLEYMKKCEEREKNGQENNTFLLDFTEFREKNDGGK